MAIRDYPRDISRVMQKIKLSGAQYGLLQELAKTDPWRMEFPQDERPLLVFQDKNGDTHKLDLRDMPEDCFCHIGGMWELTILGRAVASYKPAGVTRYEHVSG